MRILLALMLDWLIGDPPNLWHPVAWIGSFISEAERKAPKGETWRFLYGLGLAMGGSVAVAKVAGMVGRLPKGVRYPMEVLALKLTIGAHGLDGAAAEVEAALESGELDKARWLVGWHLVSRDTSELSAEEVAGATIESLSENLTDGRVAPAFFYTIGGLPAAWAYRFVNTCDSMLGYRDEEHEWLGKAPARLDDLLNLVPARLAGGIIVLAAAILGFDSKNAWRTMISQHGKTESPNAGWTMSAAAGAFRTTLSKRGHYALEGGNEATNAETIHRARRLFRLAFLIAAACCAMLEILVRKLHGREGRGC
jgi:adenosylcobinamide-phosphate synthase